MKQIQRSEGLGSSDEENTDVNAGVSKLRMISSLKSKEQFLTNIFDIGLLIPVFNPITEYRIYRSTKSSFGFYKLKSSLR